jgi:RNA polymerase sigma-70 factor (sigma-E family)
VTQEIPEAALDRLTGPSNGPRRGSGTAEPAETLIEVLFRRHYASLLRTAYALLGTREGADDAVQEAFVSLYRHWGSLRDPGAAESYLRVAVLNRCRTRIRSLVSERSRAEDTVVPLHAVGSDEVVAGREDKDMIANALRKLPRRQREVVACRYLLELSVAETAETLGISDGAVKRHAHRGLHALHTALEVTR